MARPARSDMPLPFAAGRRNVASGTGGATGLGATAARDLGGANCAATAAAGRAGAGDRTGAGALAMAAGGAGTAPGILRTVWHLGQRTALPRFSSATCRMVLQEGQVRRSAA